MLKSASLNDKNGLFRQEIANIELSSESYYEQVQETEVKRMTCRIKEGGTP